MQTFELELPDGARLAGAETGAHEGIPLLLLSGLGGTAGFWQALLAHLTPWRCIVFDQRGIAGSTRGRAPLSIAQLAQDAWAVLDARGVRRAHLLGHSTGGCIVQDMALQQPERPASLMLSATWAGPNLYMQQLFALRLALLAQDPRLYAQSAVFWSYPPDWLLAHPERLGAAATSPPWTPAQVAVVRERIRALLAHDRRAALASVSIPSLVLGAQDDCIVPFSLQQELVASLPQARMQSWPRGGHFFPQVQAEQYARTLHDSLARAADGAL